MTRVATRAATTAATPYGAPAKAPPGFAAGVRDMLPVLLGYAPAIGAAVAAHREPLAAWAGTGTIYGGSAHLAVLDLTDGGGPALAAIVTGLLINLRLIVYGASLAPHWRGTPLWFRLPAAALIVDVTWAMGKRRYGEPDPRAAHRYYLGCGLALWSGWLALITAAALGGGLLPAGLGLSVAVPLALGALVAPRLRTARGRVVIGTAVAVAVITAEFPAGTGTTLAAVCAAAAGLLWRGRNR